MDTNIDKFHIKKLIDEHPDIPKDYHPVVALAVIAHRPDASISQQIQCHKEVARYLADPRRATDRLPKIELENKSQVMFYLPERTNDDSNIIEGEVLTLEDINRLVVDV